MYLKKLELQGFKSFPEKIALTFEQGITAVVGPNGSGKSNIADAVRWVLGEQSAKSLRGQKMEDVIFAGTQNRRPLGFAEVEMTIDNANGALPVDFSEVTISRRVYRSGESDYQINGATVRLKDVHMLFMDTGVGKEGYAIISQGKIDDVLNAKSEERRLIFEEAAGIVKYKSRCQEAGVRLEKEKQNLIRIHDIASEIATGLPDLELQATKAKKYLSAAQKLKRYEIGFFLIEETRIGNEMAENANHCAIIMDQIEQIGMRQQNTIVEESNAKNQLEQISAQIASTVDGVHLLRFDVEKREGDIKLYDAQILNSTQDIKRLHSLKQTLSNRTQENLKQQQINESTATGYQLQLTQLERELHEAQDDFAQVDAAINSSEKTVESYKSEIIEKMKESSDHKAAISRLQVIREQQNERQEALLISLRTLENEKVPLSESLAQAKQKLEMLNQEESVVTHKGKHLRKEQDALHTAFERNQLAAQELLAQISKKQARLAVLKDMEKEREGFYRSVKAVLLAAKSQKLAGIHGAVGELIGVAKQYETALATALGSNIQSILVDDENSAKNAIDYLKSIHGGRATFLPVTAAKKQTAVPDFVFKHQGVLGAASTLCQYPAQFHRVYFNLLGRVIIIDTIDNAIAFSKKTKYSYRCVTLSGENISQSGAFTGGSRNERQTNLFSRGREITELQESLKVLESEKNVLEQAVDAQKERLLAMDKALARYRDKLAANRLAHTETARLIGTIRGDLESHSEKIDESTLESTQLKAQIADTQNKIKQYQQQQLESDTYIKQANTMVIKAQSLSAEERMRRDNQFEAISTLKVTISAQTQKLASINDNLARLGIESQTIAAECLAAESELISATDKTKELQQQIITAQEDIIRLKANAKTKEAQIVHLEDKKKTLENTLEALLKADKQDALEAAKAEGEKNRLLSGKEHLEEQRKRLFDALWENYSLTRSQAIAENERAPVDAAQDPRTLLRMIKELKEEIRAMGSINTDAVTQYEVQRERYAFMLSQIADIEDAEAKLRTIIDELTTQMTQLFTEQFALISESFDCVFKEMFGGGSAMLQLADSKEPLKSGIDMIVKLPGKNAQNISWLSGGERALTAIALLFGILKLKPSPFCILDEIEAALDDANIVRFSNYLKNLQDETQFIIITHRKGTMEAADVMYGVTMQEQGVSKLISVKFDTAKEQQVG